MLLDKKGIFFRFLVCEHSIGIKPSNFGCNSSSLLLLEGGPLSKNLRKLTGSYRRVSLARRVLDRWMSVVFSFFEVFKSRHRCNGLNGVMHFTGRCVVVRFMLLSGLRLEF